MTQSRGTTRSITEIRAAGERLQTAELLGWLQALPTDQDVTLEEITEQRGHQRDPVHVLVGMRARWETPL